MIYGLLGVFIVIPMMREYIQPALNNALGFLPFFPGPAYGIGFLTAGVVLAIMVIPYIISVSREVLLSVPRDQREVALALGSTRWESTLESRRPLRAHRYHGFDLPRTRRALGETMAVTMVICATRPTSAHRSFALADPTPPSSPMNLTEATGASLPPGTLIELGLVLFLLTFILNGLARILIVATSQRSRRRTPRMPADECSSTLGANL